MRKRKGERERDPSGAAEDKETKGKASGVRNDEMAAKRKIDA